MLSRIIVPLDGSQLSHAALPMARSLAKLTGAGITLLSVIDPPRDFYIAPQGTSTTRLRPKDVEHLANEEIRLQGYLDHLATTFDDIRVSTDVRLGKATEEILHAAETTPETVIVMASHGRSGLGRMLIGSVANRVVQGAHVPVFISRVSSDAPSEYGTQRIKHVTIPLDGSNLAEQALQRAWGIFGDSVRYSLVRIVEPIAQGQAYTSETVANYERQAREVAEEYLQAISDDLTSRGASVSVDVRVTQPSSGITRSAEEYGADIIAMTTHGRSGMGRFLVGSVAERVLHDSDRPVMIVRGTEEDTARAGS